MVQLSVYQSLTNQDLLYLHYATIPVFIVSTIGSEYVFFSTLLRLMYGEEFDLLNALPIMISTADCYFGVLMTVNRILLIQESSNTSAFACKFMGYAFSLAVNVNSFLLMFLAYISWRTTGQKKVLTFGPYNWQAFSFIYLAPLVLNQIPFIYGIKVTSTDGFIPTINTCPILSNKELWYFLIGFLVLALLFGYWAIWKVRPSFKFAHRPQYHSIAEYFPVLQWTPFAILVILSFGFEQLPMGSALIAEFILNAGGVVKAILYYRQQYRAKRENLGAIRAKRNGSIFGIPASESTNV